MADEGRPPPPYSLSSNLTLFDYDNASRTYGVRFADPDVSADAVQPALTATTPRYSTNDEGQKRVAASQSAKLPLRRPGCFQTPSEATGPEPETLNVQTVPFLELPAEIRNVIYELVCPLRGLAATFMARSSCLIPPPLAKTNRQVRAEVLPIFYGNNVFQIPMNDVRRELSFRCLELISPNVHLLREVRSVAPEASNKSWNVRFSMSIRSNGTYITFTSQEPLTLVSQQTIVRVLLTNKAIHFRRTFTGQDFLSFFTMLRRGTVRLEVDKRKASQRNAEHSFDIRPATYA